MFRQGLIAGGGIIAALLFAPPALAADIS